MSHWGTHTDFFYVHKTARQRRDFCHYFKIVDKVDLVSFFVSICFYCNCSSFISVFLFFFCLFVLLQPRRCDNAVVALSWQPFLHLSQNCLCSCELEVQRSSGFENSLLLHFCEISHWAGPNQLFFIVVCQEDYFCIQYVKNVFFLLLFLLTYNGF